MVWTKIRRGNTNSVVLHLNAMKSMVLIMESGEEEFGTSDGIKFRLRQLFLIWT